MQYKKSLAIGMIVALVALIMTALAIAQSDATTVIWDSYAAYGVSAGGPYVVADAVGEPMAGSSSGGGYTLTDGGPPGAIEEPPTPTPSPTPPPGDWELIYLPSVIGD